MLEQSVIFLSLVPYQQSVEAIMEARAIPQTETLLFHSVAVLCDQYVARRG